MLSKSQIKLIKSLHQKKYRVKHSLFIVEGKKSVNEFLASPFELKSLFYTEPDNEWTINNAFQISTSEMSKLSALKNANQVLAVFKIPKDLKLQSNGLILVLDDIKDPGNLGTIIRLCDWFGVIQIICSLETVDCYNPKVVQASMGSLASVPLVYTDLEKYLSKTNLPIYASLMEGNNIYKEALLKNAIIIMGNEANGISKTLMSLATHKISIPHFGQLHKTESLNVATATAIILSEFKR